MPTPTAGAKTSLDISDINGEQQNDEHNCYNDNEHDNDRSDTGKTAAVLL